MLTRYKILTKAVCLAGESIRNAIPSLVKHKEGWANIVTSADLASEEIIVKLIKSNFPSDLILSEETKTDLKDILDLERLWVIDPIDGTNNFRFQRNYACVSVGYVEKGIIKAGAVYDPFRQELFYAEKEMGAYLNNKKISAARQSELSKSTVATDNSYDAKSTKRNLELLLLINPPPWVLMKGSSVLAMCEVAAGRIDLYFHTTLNAWDNAAAFLMIEEAGGVVKGIDGSKVNFLTKHLIAGNNDLVRQCVSAFNSK